MKPLLVIKFGGTSIGTPHAMGLAASIVALEQERVPLVVVSAFCGVTDRLVDLADQARRGNQREPGQLTERHAFVFPQHAQYPPLLLGETEFLEYLPKSRHNCIQRAVQHYRQGTTEVLHCHVISL